MKPKLNTTLYMHEEQPHDELQEEGATTHVRVGKIKVTIQSTKLQNEHFIVQEHHMRT
jgi:hypothetical protein